MAWLSLRKHIDNVSGPSAVAPLPDSVPEVRSAPGRAKMTQNCIAYAEALASFGQAANKAVPGAGGDILRSFGEMEEGLERDGRTEVPPTVRDRVRAELDRWADRALRQHTENENAVKEVMDSVARAADTIGKRDEKYGREVGDLTTKLRSIANLNDISPIRKSIIETTGALKACMDRLADENKTAVGQLSAQVEHYRSKLAEVEQTASLDPLTGLANRRAFEESFERRISRRMSFLVIMMDLNDFKLVNDTFGHMAGDSLLTQFAAELKNQFRATDLVSRWGGDEFVVLVDGPFSEAEARAARIKQWALGEYTLDTGTQRVKVHVVAGMGVVEWDGCETGKQLLERADHKLYAAKAKCKAEARELVMA